MMGNEEMIRLNIRGISVLKGALTGAEQQQLVADIRQCLTMAPLVQPTMRNGKPLSVRMSAAGKFGWVSDRAGYRYAPLHPAGQPWPDIPESLLALWKQHSGATRAPECCLINWYGEGARMGLHQDRDEADFSQPVLSVSLGDDGLFRIGNKERGGKTDSVWLNSGDVVVMGGTARLLHHGVDRIRYKSSALLENGGRINLTLRVVT